MFLVFQEKIDALKVLGADVRPVPAVPFDNPDNYIQPSGVCVCVGVLVSDVFVCVSCVLELGLSINTGCSQPV